MGVVGVTGTNGKTSVAWLTRALLQTAGRATGLTGTIEYSDGGTTAPAELTTPDPGTLVRWMSAAHRNRCTHFALELAVERVDTLPNSKGWWHPLDRLDEAGLPTLYRKACDLQLQDDVLALDEAAAAP